MARITSVLVGLGMLSLSPAFAAGVTGTDPVNASNNAPVDTDVSATLGDAVVAAPAGSVIVHNSQTVRTGDHPEPVINPAATVTVDPNDNFKPGERVQVTVTNGVKTTGMVSAAPYVWTFRTSVSAGGGFFINSGNSLGGGAGLGVALGDVDGDGDLDAFVTNNYEGNRVWLNGV